MLLTTPKNSFWNPRTLLTGSVIAAALMVAQAAHAVCDLEALQFRNIGGVPVPIPGASGCIYQVSLLAGTTSTTLAPVGAKYALVSYNGGLAQVVLDSSKNKFGSSAPAGDIGDGTAWPWKPSLLSLSNNVSNTKVDRIKTTASTATSLTYEFYK